MDALPRLDHSGAIDADGHLLEPPDLWDRYIDPKYRDRAMHIRKDDEGREYVEIDNRPSKLVRRGMPGGLGLMDRLGGFVYEREPTGSPYVDNAPLGAMDPVERIERLDREGLERCILYPTLGVLWVAECEDEELTQAYLRAYNRFIVDFCSDSNGRLIPVAQLSLGDPEAAEAELRRAAAAGVRGVWVPPFTSTRRGVAHPDHDRVFAAAAELGLPLGVHPAFDPLWARQTRFAEMRGSKHTFFENVIAGDAVRHAFTSFFQYGTFAKLPDLQLIVLECGASWIGYWIDRMDAIYDSPQGSLIRERLKEKPSDVFKRQCWISADPDETTLPGVISVVGEDRFFWASDFPHPDHPPDYITNLTQLVSKMPKSARRNLLGENCARVYGL
ncbi:MAG: amidohydrolase family protein [Myxococcota bacterium]